jgi:hypothetical protein
LGQFSSKYLCWSFCLKYYRNYLFSIFFGKYITSFTYFLMIYENTILPPYGNDKFSKTCLSVNVHVNGYTGDITRTNVLFLAHTEQGCRLIKHLKEASLQKASNFLRFHVFFLVIFYFLIFFAKNIISIIIIQK